MILLDTDVFIDHFRGLAVATAYLQRLPLTRRVTTDITVMELYQGAVNRDNLAAIERFLTQNQFRVLPVSAAVSRRAVHLMHQYTLSHGLELADALIAATALEADRTLTTGNVRDFVFIERLRVMRPPYR